MVYYTDILRCFLVINKHYNGKVPQAHHGIIRTSEASIKYYILLMSFIAKLHLISPRFSLLTELFYHLNKQRIIRLSPDIMYYQITHNRSPLSIEHGSHCSLYVSLCFVTEFKASVMSVPVFACMAIVSLKQILSSRQNQVTGE